MRDSLGAVFHLIDSRHQLTATDRMVRACLSLFVCLFVCSCLRVWLGVYLCVGECLCVCV